MTQFITLAGKKQVGKDTSAGIICKFLTSDEFKFYVDETGEVRLRMSVGCGPLGEGGFHRVHIVHFADALKKACNIIFGIPLEDMETEEGKQKLTHVRWPQHADGDHGYVPFSAEDGDVERFMTVREILQFVGTDLFRNQIDPDVWVESVFRQPWNEDDIIIIADARFPNEAEIARKHGLLINIVRSTGLESDGHKSETALAEYTDYHYTVHNNSSIDDLVANLGFIMNAKSLLA
ncbi:MAG: deoxynucleotide monophosphate kinase family protein [Candidatus Thorarchaeota archaeon]|jgi:hypothetical protein